MSSPCACGTPDETAVGIPVQSSTVTSFWQSTKQRATVNLVTTIVNGRSADTAFTLRVKLLGPTGKTLQTGETNLQAGADGRVEIPLAFEVKSPPLWSPESPLLCQAVVQVFVGGKEVDASTTTFGIREIKFSTNGFTLNGVSVKLRGGCLHHDLGPLGSESFDRAEDRRVALL